MVTEHPNVTPFGHYTKQQAADALGVNRRTIYRWCRAGLLHLRYNKVLHTNYILGSDILKLWEG